MTGAEILQAIGAVGMWGVLAIGLVFGFVAFVYALGWLLRELA